MSGIIDLIYPRLLSKESLLESIDDPIHINKSAPERVSLSIVCTAFSRAPQTYYTLKTWDHVAKLNNTKFQFIIVEDTPQPGARVDPHALEKEYENLWITYIFISKKKWINPCLNYNIGFDFAVSERIVITNAEVCVFGDIYKIICNRLTDDNYLVFDVAEAGTRQTHNSVNKNEFIWREGKEGGATYDEFISSMKSINTWFLQGPGRDLGFHFLTCITRKNLEKAGGFDEDFFYGSSYDDNALVFVLKNELKLKFETIGNEENKVIGFHQWHSTCPGTHIRINLNDRLWNFKRNYFKKHGKYLRFRDYPTLQECQTEACK